MARWISCSVSVSIELDGALDAEHVDGAYRSRDKNSDQQSYGDDEKVGDQLHVRHHGDSAFSTSGIAPRTGPSLTGRNT